MMINGFNKCNYVSGQYRSTDEITNFKFNVKFKEINKMIPLPNFEQFTQQNGNSENNDCSEHYEERSLCWQEKVLSSREVFLYKDSTNCKTDVEKKYHDLIEENDLKSTIHSPKLFTYVQDDKFTYSNHLTTKFKNLGHLESKLHKLTLLDHDKSENVDVFKSEVSPPKTEIEQKDDENISYMYVMIDMNNSESDPSFILKRELVLFVLEWSHKYGKLTVSPNFNNLFSDPYVLETNYYSKQVFHYSIVHVVPSEPDDAKLAEMQLLDKFYDSQHSIRNSKVFKNFITPPKNILKCLFVVEIVSVNVEDYLSSVYVEYTVELPFGYMTNDSLRGVTQMSKPGKNNASHFGHVFELCLHYQMGVYTDDSELPKDPEIYFEIISCDTWGRHRTEGYCYSKLYVMQPGQQRVTLKCFRPQGLNKRLWEMNRFFVGGKHLLNDLTWLSTPSTVEGKKLNKFGIRTVSSGSLELSINSIIQSRNFIKHKDAHVNDTSQNLQTVAERLTTDSLFKSVNTVLQAYKRAKDKLLSTQEPPSSSHS